MRFTDVQDWQPQTAAFFASYEYDRAIAVAQVLAGSGWVGDPVVFYCEDLPDESTSPSLSAFRRLFPNVREIPVSYRAPLPIARAVAEIGRPESLLVDTSCFNRGNLYPFLWACRFGMEWQPSLTFAYTPPASYGESWLSRDYAPPTNMLGFPGGLDPTARRVLICLVGYETDRALEVIKAVEPSQVIITVGTIPTLQEFADRNWRAVRQAFGSPHFDIREIDVSNPQGSLEDLRAIVRSLPADAAVDLAPFNTKLSCLAAWALWLERPDIRIWNAQPATYNVMNYSKGSADPRYYGVDWDAD